MAGCVGVSVMVAVLLTAVATAVPTALTATPSFKVANDQFQKDGKEFRILAGCIHYSRVPPELWEDRLVRLKSMGLNAIQTYVPWNWHEPVKGSVDFSSPSRDLPAFLSLAQKHDLLVVLRAGPYMCGEWEFGGFPAWLFSNGSIPLRTYSQPYISHVDDWWGQSLLPAVKPFLYANGGPVVMVQVENEYGSYGDVSKHPTDKQYMQHLVELARAKLGSDVILFTTDGGNTGYMTRGSLPGADVLTVGDGCGNPETCWSAQQQFNPPGLSAPMCSECYTGWLTHWGQGGANTSSAAVARHTASVLNAKGSISLYMGHGGTNFGFFSGANGNGGSSYAPHETSYDYDSPVAEAGEHGYGSDHADKYAALQQVFSEFTGVQPEPEPPLMPRKAFGTIKVTASAALLDNIPTLSPKAAASATTAPEFVEQYGPDCYYGFVLYETTLASALSGNLSIGNVRDRAQVFVDGQYMGATYRVSPTSIAVTAKAGAKLQILVENMGRINFSHGMDDELKGILGAVTLAGKAVAGPWTTHCLPMTNLTGLKWQTPVSTAGPAFFRAEFDVDTVADTFFSTSGWVKGIAWINGFNLGRYWETKGPQHTLYIPSPRLKKGTNELIILELHNGTTQAQLVGQPDLHKPSSERRLHKWWWTFGK